MFAHKSCISGSSGSVGIRVGVGVGLGRFARLRGVVGGGFTGEEGCGVGVTPGSCRVRGVLMCEVAGREGGGVGTGTALRVRGVRSIFFAAGDRVEVAGGFEAAAGGFEAAAGGFEEEAGGFEVAAVAGLFAGGLLVGGALVVAVVAGRAGGLGCDEVGRAVGGVERAVGGARAVGGRTLRLVVFPNDEEAVDGLAVVAVEGRGRVAVVAVAGRAEELVEVDWRSDDCRDNVEAEEVWRDNVGAEV